MLTLVAAATAQASGISPRSEAGRDSKFLNKSLKRLVATDGGPPGAIAVVQRKGDRRRVIKAGYGNLTPQERPHAQDHMRIASVAKAFSAAVALSLVEDGLLTLDTTIGQRLPDLPAAWHGVTLRQLLQHTSGVPDYTQDPDFQSFYGANPQADIPPRALLDFVADEPLGFVPGSEYRYSNSDNIIVGLMAEAATGTPYATLLQTQIYAPLGLKGTSLPNTSAIPDPFLHGFDISFGSPPEDISNVLNPSGAWASGGILSTPADLNRFIRGYVGGKLFGKAQRVEQFDFSVRGNSDPPGPGSNFAGLGIFKYNSNCGTVFGHTGSFPGYTQFAVASRSGKASATVSINTVVLPDEPAVFKQLIRAERHAVCFALAKGR